MSYNPKHIQFCEPSFLIIGSQKSGTSKLAYYMKQHPQIRPAKQKEVHYFDNNYHRSLDWYRSHFPPVGMFSGLITGEASPYYMFHPLAPLRVFETFPDIKLIVILKNPVDRAYSHYQHNRRRKREERSFEKALGEEAALLEGEKEKMSNSPIYFSFNYMHYSYMARGIYVDQLKQWTGLFPLKRFKIIDSREFFEYPHETMNDVFQFLGCKPLIIKKSNKRNHAGYSPMQPETRFELSRFFKPFNRELSLFLSRDFLWE